LTESTPATLAVIGAGTMGHGIAHVSALAGYTVRMHDPQRGAVEKALGRIADNLAKGVERGKLSAADAEAARTRLRPADTLKDAVQDAALVIEAAPEVMEVKERLFADLFGLAPMDAVLASNTSSLSITRIAAATGAPDRVVGLHFFNPVHIMKLLEVVRGRDTSTATLDAALAYAERIGKQPIVVSDTPGFASSRLGVVLGLEAMRMLEQGVASAEDIDRAMELGYNHPMGPLRLTDVVGLDVRLGIAEYLHRELKEDQYRPPEILRRLVHEGKLGKKSGEGFYPWGNP
jgi:3-hydroxybutyryl-CoA dehydrogenase